MYFSHRGVFFRNIDYTPSNLTAKDAFENSKPGLPNASFAVEFDWVQPKLRTKTFRREKYIFRKILEINLSIEKDKNRIVYL